ncbi:sugar-binding domain-containing protein [Arcanobacterium hippocoleae]
MDYTPQLHSKDVQAIDAAKLYYSGLSQAEVAQRLHVARPTVSKLLSHAQRRGFVRIQVIDPREHDERLVETLQERYRLREVVLVSPAQNDMQTLRDNLGRAGAKLLQSLVRDEDLIGIVPSRTISMLASYLEYTPRNCVSIVQMSNGFSLPATNKQESILYRIANAFGASCISLKAPTFSHSVIEQNRLMRNPELRKVFELMSTARFIVYTVGDTESNRDLILRAQLRESEKEILFSRSVGDICSRFIDMHGRICVPDLNNRTFGISLPQVRHMEQKILIAGEKQKFLQ